MPDFIEDRHGADSNVAVRIGAAPNTVREHVCRGSIPLMVRPVYASVERPKRRLASISARAAAYRC